MGNLKKRIIAVGVFTVLYALLIGIFVGWRSDHTTILLLIVGLGLAHERLFKIVITLSAFLIFWIIYDSLRIYPSYRFNPVHILDLYQHEIALFGVMDGGKCISLCEWFVPRKSDVLSFLAGAFYILWMPLPIGYAIYLSLKDKARVFDFTYGFLLTCFLGFIIYYAYPAAPPWYYLNFGETMDSSIPGSEGLLSEFDRLVGSPIFKNIYVKNGNVFCAVPSLHSAYPIITLYTAIKTKNKWLVGVFSIWAFGTWFAAVYSQHHYVIDVVLGIVCAIIAGLMIDYFGRFAWYRNLSQRFLKEI